MPLEIALATIGATVLIVGLFSELLKRTPLQEPLLCVAVGIAVGPFGFGWLDTGSGTEQSRLLEQLAQLTLAIALMAAALRVTAEHLRRLWRPVALLLTLGMLGMWLASSLSAAWLLGLPFWGALLLGAIVTPTDPVVASSIVTGRFAQQHLPDRIRSSLTMESGANDGLSYLFVMLPIIVLAGGSGPFGEWFTVTLLRGLLLSIVLGSLLGYGAGRVLHWAHHARLIESYSFLTFTTTLSLFTLSAAGLLGSNALLAVFVAGVVFTLSTDTGEAHEEERIQESMNKLFTLPTFVVFGVAAPLAGWLEHGWPLAAFVVSVLMLRRLPIVTALWPAMQPLGRRDTAYVGWFGPIGIAALYYASVAVERTGDDVFWIAGSAVIFASILVHGVTAASFTRLYSRKQAESPR
jgi:sodium/hydrogen antiporter